MANDQSQFSSGQAPSQFSRAQKCKITNDEILAPLFDKGSNLILLMDLLHQLIYLKWAFPWIAQTQASGITSITVPLWNLNLRQGTPDRAVLLDGYE
jgi:hypothetical protein